jgi:hypothetical protein
LLRVSDILLTLLQSIGVRVITDRLFFLITIAFKIVMIANFVHDRLTTILPVPSIRNFIAPCMFPADPIATALDALGFIVFVLMRSSWTRQ